jgi:hypothetical protein
MVLDDPTDSKPTPASQERAKRQWVVPLSIILGALLLSLVLGSLFNRRTVKEVDFVGSCSGFMLPKEKTWNLPNLASVHLRGFGAAVENIEGVRVRKLGGSEQWGVTKIDRFELRVNPERDTEPPSLVAMSEGRPGSNSFISIPEGSRLEGAEMNPQFGPTVSIVWNRGTTGTIQMQADQLTFPELNRMLLIDGATTPAWLSHAESISAVPESRGFQMMSARFTPLPTTGQPAEVDLRFAQSPQPANMLPAHPTPDDDQFVTTDFTLQKCANAIVKVNEQDAPRQPRDVPYDIVVSAREMELHSLNIVPPDASATERPLRWRLLLRFTATAKSVKVGAIELVPTELEELLSGSLARKGVLACLSVLGLLGLTIVLKTSIERIMDVVVPQRRRGTYVDKRITIEASGQGNVINVAEIMANVTNTVANNVERASVPKEVKMAVNQLTS